MGFLNGGNFIIKSNNTELHTLFKTCNNYNSPYKRYFPFLIY